MKRVLIALVAYAAMFARADAAIVETTFDDWKNNPVVIGDKIFTYIAGGNNFNNAEIVFASTAFPNNMVVYDMDVFFIPSLIGTVIDLDYSVEVTNPNSHLTGLGIDSQIGALGTNFDVTKTYYSSPNHQNQVAHLVSTNGGNSSVLGNFGQKIYTHVQATVPATNDLDSFHDGYTQVINTIVPEPSSIALLAFGGVGLVFGGWRRRRQLANPVA
jgi:hypothetical protein